MLGHRPLELPDYLAILKRRLWLILTCALLFPVLAIGVTFFLQPKFLSQTLVIIQEQKVPDEYVKPVISSNLDSRLSSMKEQILSRSRIQPIVEKYSLYPGKHLTMDDRIDLARKSIDIKPIKSEVARAGGLPGFFITFTASDPHTAQQVCGEITSLFVNENSKEREASVEGTTDFLQGQLDDAKRSLDEQDAKLAEFQRQYIGKLPGESAPNLNMLTSLNTQLEAITQQLARMEQDKTYEESLLAQQMQAQNPAAVPGLPAPPPVDSPELTADKAELQKLQSSETDMLSHYTADYPDVVSIRRRIVDLQHRISAASKPAPAGTAAAAARVPDSLAVQQLRAQVRAATIGIDDKRREQAQIQSAVHLYQDRIQSSPLVEEQYKVLTRDYDTAQKFYDTLLQKKNNSKMATDLERRQEGELFSVMDEPNLPDAPIFPKRWMFALGGLAAGIALGLGFAALLEYRDTTLRTERDIYAFTSLPTLAVISVAGSIPEEQPEGSRWRFWRRSSTAKLSGQPAAGASA